jgi:alpha-tubulin suppressor-like RCC1 family protein
VVSSLDVSPSAVKLEEGEEQQMTVVARGPTGDTILNGSVEWSTRNPFTAAVSQTGVVSARRTGLTWVVAVFGMADSARVEVVPYAPPFAQLTVGGDEAGGHTCGLAANGDAYCWGQNGRGQLGTGDTLALAWPTAVAGGLKFTLLSAGAAHTCGVATGGAVYCWGANGRGQLGDNTTDDRLVPTAVIGGLTFSAVSAGQLHTCAVLDESATAYCWGANSFGQLGSNDTISRAAPNPVFGMQAYQEVSAGGGHTCAVTSGGLGQCWGDNSSGQLGANATFPWASIPVVVVGVSEFNGISAGGQHSCGAGRTGGDVAATFCWGNNSTGQLGIGAEPNQIAPVEVSGDRVYPIVDAGLGHTCARTGSGAGFCWGFGSFGQLGDGLSRSSVLPVGVAGSILFESVSAGSGHTCGVDIDGRSFCWGRNASGELGDESTENRSTPVEAGE